jgi:hypothetical protein
MSTASPLTTVASGLSSGPANVVEITVAGMVHIRATQASRTSDSSVLEANMPSKSRYVLAPKTIRCSCSYRPRR